MANLEMRNLTDHYPHREDQIEAWIKDRRDEWDLASPIFDALDNLLDEYRLAADTGQSLEEVVNSQWYEEHAQEEQERLRKRTPKKKKE